MVKTTPGALIKVNGISYLTFMGPFLFKDVIALGFRFLY
jgi:hypothetical protein